MNKVLKGLKPEAIFEYFEEISRIPRCSGKEKEVSDYLVNFAKDHDLEFIQDDAWNVIIKKPGTSGYENAPTVIIQGHMDMVCEKNRNTVHDFDKDPIKLKVEDDCISAEGTTLGADNGIAIAYGLALLASTDIPHPPLEILITTDEEIGMAGAMAVDSQNLNGRILVNIDSEEEGELLVSCAGGMRAHFILPISWQKAQEEDEAYVIELRGLKGGHSGQDIDQGRGNANKLMGRILNDLTQVVEYDLIELFGGAKDNAIPREMDAIINLSPKNKTAVEQRLVQWESKLKNEYKVSDPGITVNLTQCENQYKNVFSLDTKKKAISVLMLLPNGIQTMSMEMKGLPESSLNLGVVSTNKDEIRFVSAVRSSVRSLKDHMLDQIKTLAKMIGAKVEVKNEYPAWEYNPDSVLRNIFINVYKNLYGKEPLIKAIHAGLECGVFAEKIEGLDIISFGPDMWDVHTPDERLSIPSAARTWEYLLAVLAEIY